MTKVSRAISSAIALSVFAGLSMAPSTANAGFFEQLFGGSAPQPREYSYEPPAPGMEAPVPYVTRRPKKRTVALEAKPTLQKPTDLMHDATLQPGDAVMMKDGIHIYQGSEASKHTDRQFVAIDDAGDLSHKTKADLVAMDLTRNDPLRGELTPNTIASGRSASVSVPVTPGFRVTDARGKSIRYVGP